MTELSPNPQLIDAPDDPSELVDYLDARGEGDGLPLIPPTPTRVSRFLEEWGRDGAEEIAAIPPGMGILSAEKLAAIAVMAGCKPSYLSVLAGAVQAACSPNFNLNTIQITSNPATVLVLVNGPIRGSVSINSGANCMGHGARANVTIGRAMRLVLQNVGLATVGDVDRSCHGFPGKIAFCFGENEEESPWEPLHIDRGFSATDSVVTVVAAQGTSNIIVHGRLIADDLLPILAHGMINPGANNFCLVGGEPVLVLNPGHARALQNSGVGRTELREYLYDHARIPVDWYPARAQQVSSMEDRAINGMLPVANSPEDIIIVVAGEAGSHSVFIPTYGESAAISALIPDCESRAIGVE